MEHKIELPAARYSINQVSVRAIWLLSFGSCAAFWALMGYLLWTI